MKKIEKQEKEKNLPKILSKKISKDFSTNSRKLFELKIIK